MPFSYYRNLSRADQAIYRASDRVHSIVLPDPAAIRPLVAEVEAALKSGEQPAVEAATQRLADALTVAVGVPPVVLRVLARRPKNAEAELHGMYHYEDPTAPRIELWMRTAVHSRVVAFRTWLRTLLHELCHHFDFQLLQLGDSFHTEGFYKRESSLFHQLVPSTEETP